MAPTYLVVRARREGTTMEYNEEISIGGLDESLWKKYKKFFKLGADADAHKVAGKIPEESEYPLPIADVLNFFASHGHQVVSSMGSSECGVWTLEKNH